MAAAHHPMPMERHYRSLMMACACFCAEYSDVWSIHREAPEFVEQSTEQEILVTGIKVHRAFSRSCLTNWA